MYSSEEIRKKSKLGQKNKSGIIGENVDRPSFPAAEPEFFNGGPNVQSAGWV